MRRRHLLALVIAFAPLSAFAQQQLPVPPIPPQQAPKQTAWVQHHVVIQIDQNDPSEMNLALNNASNMKQYWNRKGETSEIEFVAFGPGLAMVRSDQSPVKDRIAALSKEGIVFSGCGNTKANQSKAEQHPVTFLDEVTEVPTGVARITELQEQGWTYLRP